jgi:hypothetical protein
LARNSLRIAGAIYEAALAHARFRRSPATVPVRTWELVDSGSMPRGLYFPKELWNRPFLSTCNVHAHARAGFQTTPYPSIVARFAPAIEQVVMAYFGVQCREEPASTGAVKVLKDIASAFGSERVRVLGIAQSTLTKRLHEYHERGLLERFLRLRRLVREASDALHSGMVQPESRERRSNLLASRVAACQRWPSCLGRNAITQVAQSFITAFRIFARLWMTFGSRPTKPSITGLSPARTPGQEGRGTGSELAALSDAVSEATPAAHSDHALPCPKALNKTALICCGPHMCARVTIPSS